jgi:hypothetical protein
VAPPLRSAESEWKPLRRQLAVARDAVARDAVARDAVARDAVARDAVARDADAAGWHWESAACAPGPSRSPTAWSCPSTGPWPRLSPEALLSLALVWQPLPGCSKRYAGLGLGWAQAWSIARCAQGPEFDAQHRKLIQMRVSYLLKLSS